MIHDRKPYPTRALQEVRTDILAMEKETEDCWAKSSGEGPEL